MIEAHPHLQPRGYVPLHTSGCRCPGCHRSQWWIGRISAECAACGTAIPLAPREAAHA